jgi:hypothetical protein
MALDMPHAVRIASLHDAALLNKKGGLCPTSVCDTLTASLSQTTILYVFVAIEIGSRRILLCNVTGYPSQNGPDSSFGRSSVLNPAIDI